MGRGKLKMELIPKQKQRLLTFKKRKEGLIKKLHQLSTLCDVSACMVIVDPFQNQTSTWPERDPDQVRRLIEAYRSKDMSSVKPYGVAEYLEERRKKAEEELQKLRKINSMAKFPTWNPAFDSMSDAHLRALAASLLPKAQAIRSRIQAMRAREAQDLEMMKAKMMLFNSNHHFYNLDQHHEFKPPAPPINSNSGMQVPMNMQQQHQHQQQQQHQHQHQQQHQQQQQVVPHNYYAPPPPMPPQPQPYMIVPANMQLQYYQTSTMDQHQINPNINYYSATTSLENFNYWAEDDKEASRYLFQQLN